MCDPSGGALTVDKPAGYGVEACGGRDVPEPGRRRAAAIGSCDVINRGKWLLPAQNRRRQRRNWTDWHASWEAPWLHLSLCIFTIHTHPGLDPIFWHSIPAEINEGETLVPEVLSEIQHGSQSECKVQDSGGGGQPVREDCAASRVRQGLFPWGEAPQTGGHDAN